MGGGTITQGGSWLQTVSQGGLLLWLLVGSVGQRIAFKNVGYVLGAYPYFVLLVISGAFVIIFAVLCGGIIVATGGFLPETKTWRCLAIYSIIGCCNAFQGGSMVFANPHVEGYLQTLLQQAVIPFTMIVSAATLRARFSLFQYTGVLLIILGLCMQLMPSSTGSGAASSESWICIFLAGQLPVACAAVLQEQAFQEVPVNVFHMMYWASLAQFLALLLLVPIDCMPWMGDTSSLYSFIVKFSEAWQLVSNGHAAGPLWGSIVAMFLAQLAQTFMVKLSSAAFTVLCLALVVPTSAAAFASPLLMGVHSEHLNPKALLALLLVFVGITCYRLGAVPVPKDDNVAAVALLCEKEVEASPSGERRPSKQPPLCTAGVGLIGSEYSNARASPLNIWEERTLKEP